VIFTNKQKKLFYHLIHKHQNFNPIVSSFQNDIALLQLEQPVILNDYAQIACLPNPLYGIYPSMNNITTLYAVGWVILSSF
jgi:hypothetical protein